MIAPVNILHFSPRGPFAVRVEHHHDEWLAICRGHCWAFATRQEALAEATDLAAGFGVAVEVVPAARHEYREQPEFPT
jgi:hypothetical protein